MEFPYFERKRPKDGSPKGFGEQQAPSSAHAAKMTVGQAIRLLDLAPGEAGAERFAQPRAGESPDTSALGQCCPAGR